MCIKAPSLFIIYVFFDQPNLLTTTGIFKDSTYLTWDQRCHAIYMRPVQCLTSKLWSQYNLYYTYHPIDTNSICLNLFSQAILVAYLALSSIVFMEDIISAEGG